MAKGVSTKQLFLDSGILSEESNRLYLNGLLVGSGIYQPTGNYALNANLAQTGSILDNKINSLSGFTLGASGALQAQIGAGGVTQGQLDSVSGWTDTFFVHRTGNELVSGIKTFITGVVISGNLNVGFNTRTVREFTFAQGRDNIASGRYSHAEGSDARALGDYSHAEGAGSRAFGLGSHAEGYGRAIGNYSHSEGYNDFGDGSFGQYSHHEGYNNRVSGNGAHGEGYLTWAVGRSSHSEGLSTIAREDYSHAQGKYNRDDVTGLFQVGRGTSTSDRNDVIYVSASGSNPSILSGRWHFETGAQIGDNRILTGIVAGTNITVNNNNDGTFTVSGSAGGGGTKTYAFFTANDNNPPGTGFATLDTRNSISVLDFDDTTEESAIFQGIMVEAASLGDGLKTRIHWMGTTATAGAARWGVAIERGNTDLDTDSFDTAAEATTTTNATAGIPSVTEITITTIDGLVAGEFYRLKVYRDTSDGADTMVGDAELLAVEVRSAS